MKSYYTIIVREDGTWSPQFGDYSKEVCEQEVIDQYRAQYKKKDIKIICTPRGQKYIDAAIKTLNFDLDKLPRDVS